MPEFYNAKDVTVTQPAQKLSTWSFELPWPSPRLSPNARGHWAIMAKAKKAYRATCRRIADEHALSLAPKAPTSVMVALTFVPPDRRHRDLDNLLASMKSGLDGLADSMGVNDSLFRVTMDLADDPVKEGLVLVEVGVLA